MLAGQSANSLPLWKRDGSGEDLYLYSGIDGKWHVPGQLFANVSSDKVFHHLSDAICPDIWWGILRETGFPGKSHGIDWRWLACGPQYSPSACLFFWEVRQDTMPQIFTAGLMALRNFLLCFFF